MSGNFHVPMKDRCIHHLNPNLFCIHCDGSYWLIKDDPRPANEIRKSRSTQ